MNNSSPLGIPATLTAVALMAFAPVPVWALDYQIHGSVAQGFALSGGNNAYGDSESGSLDFYEIGLNGTVQLAPGLLASGQLQMRDAGANDNGALRLDYGLLDYQFARDANYNLGIRAGRVKNPLGLYNDSRDVVFTRPGIQLPQSIYYDSQGLRSVLFSNDGGQLYGGYSFGEQYTSMVVGAGREQRLSRQEERELFGTGSDFPGEINLSNFFSAQIRHEWNNGTDRVAFSHLRATLSIEPDPAIPVSGQADFSFYILSFRHDAERYSISSEYSLTTSKGNYSAIGSIDSKGDGFYVQGDYRLSRQWSVMARYDATYSDRNDRDGRDYAAETGGDRHSRYAEDYTIGTSWLPNEHWGAWAEWHFINGTATVPSLDNLDRNREHHWNLLLLMVGYRF